MCEGIEKGFRSGAAISISKTILDYVTEHAEGVLTSNAKDDKRWDTGASILNMDIREAICVPMRGRYGVVGVIYIDTSSPPQQLEEEGNKFREEHLKLMIAIAHQARACGRRHVLLLGYVAGGTTCCDGSDHRNPLAPH